MNMCYDIKCYICYLAKDRIQAQNVVIKCVDRWPTLGCWSSINPFH